MGSERSDPKKVELKRMFATFDKNGDGFITKQELKESLTNIRMFLTEKEVEEMVVKLDMNGDGLIDFDEFCILCKAIDDDDESCSKSSEEEGHANGGEMLKDAFDVFDRDHDGLITVEELGSVLNSLGLKEGDRVEDCREMIRKVDIDGDGMVDFDEFKTMMKNGGPLVSIPRFPS
ncbi:GTPase-activating protein gyp7-like [Hibiscus syriacus]|uniref:GTPase-activating protein gyp7-like n=1 Tax=Hibiscus syriacus TaxID=106335 RepID=A0A6A2X3B1_HIBSY|nr:GTPase-activating protein gyp7-like [Hibiscus syriacus]